MTDSKQQPSLLFITTADPDSTPHAEWIPWTLEKAGWRVTTVTPAGNGSLLRQVLGARWNSRALPFGRGRNRLAAEYALLRELLRARFGSDQVIYLHSQGLGWRAALVFLGPLFGKRLVYHNPDYFDPVTYPIRTTLEGILARRCDLVINHEFHRGYIMRAEYRLRCPVLVAPPHLPIGWPVPPRSEQRRSELAGGREDAFILRLHSGFHPRRMVPQILEALAILPERFRLAMTGRADGSADPAAERLMTKLGISGRVVTLPRLGYGAMLEYTASSDAGILLYANNDLGNFFQAPGRLTEYLACGLPVIASRFTGIENLVLRYGIGCCAESGDPARLADAILQLESQVRSGRFSPTLMRHRFETHFAYDHWESRILGAFERALRFGRGPSQAPPPEYWFPQPIPE
jgi:glycosyltransferase involved in cell wall biosynthesis